MKNYYSDLPSGFIEDYSIDASNKKTGIILNFISLLLFLGVGAICFFAKFYNAPMDYSYETLLIFLLGVVVAISAYMIIHELTHGLFYWLLTKQKLVFGLTWSAAYCGLKSGYVNKTTSLVAVLAPFVIHSIWMILLIILLPASPWILALAVTFAMHFGGCVGDLFVSFLLIVKYHKKQILVSDSGTKQTFYVKTEN